MKKLGTLLLLGVGGTAAYLYWRNSSRPDQPALDLQPSETVERLQNRINYVQTQLYQAAADYASPRINFPATRYQWAPITHEVPTDGILDSETRGAMEVIRHIVLRVPERLRDAMYLDELAGISVGSATGEQLDDALAQLDILLEDMSYYPIAADEETRIMWETYMELGRVYNGMAEEVGIRYDGT
jgi:hypothetical protein